MASISRFQAILLVFLAIVSAPLSIAALFFSSASLVLIPTDIVRRRIRRSTGFKPKKIFVFGVGTPAGLRLARAFHEAGHDVIGADYEPRGIPIHARWSSALKRFYKIRQRHDNAEFDFRNVALKERPDLWIDATADSVSATQARKAHNYSTECISFVPPINQAKQFSSQADFLAFARSHDLPAPEKHQVKSRGDIHNILNDSQGKKQYALTYGAADQFGTWPHSQTLLPRRTRSQTYNEVSRLKIARNTPWMLEQYIEGLERYTTFSVVVHGQVKAFAACTSADPLYQQPIMHTSALSHALLRSVQKVVKTLDADFTSHLCMDFVVEEKANERGLDKTVLPIDGRTKVESSVLFFRGIDGSLDLAKAYLSALNPVMNGLSKNGLAIQNGRPDDEIAMPSTPEKGIYSVGKDIVELFLGPLSQFLSLKISPSRLFKCLVVLFNHIFFWKECIYDFKDPYPFWYLYQIYLPIQLISFVLHGKARDQIAVNVGKLIE